MKKKILIAEDENATIIILKKILEKAGYSVDTACDGIDAYNQLIKTEFDLLLTDWMMPRMDGIELIRKVRKNIDGPPAIIVITALSSAEARSHAFGSGADDFIAKPFQQKDLLEKLENTLQKAEQKSVSIQKIPVITPTTLPAFNGVCIAASSGGPQTFLKLLESIQPIKGAAVFIVQHGPVWALRDIADRWKRTFCLDVILGEDGLQIEPEKIYLAPGGYHMVVGSDPPVIQLNDDPPENYTKPAADPLFRSVAKVFGKKSIGVVMTGMGSDGANGLQYIAAAGGTVIVQDPATAVVNTMPNAAIKAVPDSIIKPLSVLADSIIKHASEKK